MEKLEIKQDGQTRELFMSFGLLNVLTGIVGDPDRVVAIPLNRELRETVLREVLTERSKSGKPTGGTPEIDDLEISVADVEKILAWVAEHVLGFFMRALKQVSAVTEKHRPEVEGLLSSFGGSKD